MGFGGLCCPFVGFGCPLVGFGSAGVFFVGVWCFLRGLVFFGGFPGVTSHCAPLSVFFAQRTKMSNYFIRSTQRPNNYLN